MDLETFIEHASTFAALQKHTGRKRLIQQIEGHDVLNRDDSDHLADFLEELSPELSDEYETQSMAEDIRRRPRGG